MAAGVPPVLPPQGTTVQGVPLHPPPNPGDAAGGMYPGSLTSHGLQYSGGALFALGGPSGFVGSPPAVHPHPHLQYNYPHFAPGSYPGMYSSEAVPIDSSAALQQYSGLGALHARPTISWGIPAYSLGSPPAVQSAALAAMAADLQHAGGSRDATTGATAGAAQGAGGNGVAGMWQPISVAAGYVSSVVDGLHSCNACMHANRGCSK
jgi:hypothetical protein